VYNIFAAQFFFRYSACTNFFFDVMAARFFSQAFFFAQIFLGEYFWRGGKMGGGEK
jgi:hypothetical protein